MAARELNSAAFQVRIVAAEVFFNHGANLY